VERLACSFLIMGVPLTEDSAPSGSQTTIRVVAGRT